MYVQYVFVDVFMCAYVYVYTYTKPPICFNVCTVCALCDVCWTEVVGMQCVVVLCTSERAQAGDL